MKIVNHRKKNNIKTNSALQLCHVSLFLSSKPISSETSSPSPQTAPPEHIPLARVSSASRSYDLQERRRTGNMTGAEQAKYQRIPTDESEAQTLASADLDGIKSEYRQNVTLQTFVKKYFYVKFTVSLSFYLLSPLFQKEVMFIF